MIYVDTSVVLAQLLAEDRQPPESLWDESLVSSRLLQYEVWIRIHARGLGDSHGEFVRECLNRLAFLELAPAVLERALEPFPVALRTLDALHFSSLLFLRAREPTVELASYDARQLVAARLLRLPVADLGMGG